MVSVTIVHVPARLIFSDPLIATILQESAEISPVEVRESVEIPSVIELFLGSREREAPVMIFPVPAKSGRIRWLEPERVKVLSFDWEAIWYCTCVPSVLGVFPTNIFASGSVFVMVSWKPSRWFFTFSIAYSKAPSACAYEIISLYWKRESLSSLI